MLELKACPFCGAAPRLTARPDNAQGSMFFAAVACYCGGYSACAHKMGSAPTQDEAETLARSAWNGRQPPELLESQQAEIERLRALLAEAGALFRFYEQSHRAKGPGHEGKAQRNAEIAGRIEAAMMPN